MFDQKDFIYWRMLALLWSYFSNIKEIMDTNVLNVYTCNFVLWQRSLNQDESKNLNACLDLTTPAQLNLHRYNFFYLQTDTHTYANTHSTSPTRVLLSRGYMETDPFLGW